MKAEELRWNWNSIDTNNISFPSNFFWGVSDSALQAEGMESDSHTTVEDSWTAFEQQSNISFMQRVGNACHRWSLFKEDIQLIKDCSLNMYRFSIAWNKIEPEEGKFNHEAMKHYIDVVDELLANNIEPMIVLFHHTYPTWFARKGGFENEYNAFYFMRFADYVFKHLHKKVKYWVIMNEPVAFALEAYWRGNYPPAKKSFKTAGIVARNLLNLCVDTAQRLKKIDGNCKIGIIHIMNLLDSYHEWNPIEKISTKIFDYIVNNLTIQFFKTGKFNWAFFVREYNKQAPKTLDFIGINYYTHTIIRHKGLFTIKPDKHPYEKYLTQNNNDGRGCKVIYAEGLYRSIRRASALKIPIFITENGSSTDNAALTEEYLKKHIYALSQALKDGYDVRGYLLWTLTDCFGWKKGYSAKHGIYHVDFQTQQRTFRPAFQWFIDTIKSTH